MEITTRARTFVAVTLASLTLFVAVALVTASSADWPFRDGASLRAVANPTGPFGSLLAWTFTMLFGAVLAWIVPVNFALGAGAAMGMRAPGIRRFAWKSLLAVILLNAFFALAPLTRGSEMLHGAIGERLASSLELIFGAFGSTIILVAGVLLLALSEFARIKSAATLPAAAARQTNRLWSSAWERLSGLFARYRSVLASYRAGAWEEEDDDMEEEIPPERDAVPASASAARAWEEPAPAAARAQEAPRVVTGVTPRRATARKASVPRERETRSGGRSAPLERASLPSLDLLEQGGDEGATYSREELRNWSTVLEEKLVNYGVVGKVSAVHHGPVVTTFEFEPAPGVRIKDIVSRSDDLALAMRARSLRMIAPIPGRAAVGIEIPNPRSRVVYLYDVINQISDQQRLGGVMIGLGVDVVGEPFPMNLCEAPHLLIAGTTGSGKSVCLNCVLASILFQYRPSDVRLLLVDPKIVELSLYNGIPHLLHPVITDPKEAAKVLEYLVREMTRRNELFREQGVRNIESYNAKVAMGKTGEGEHERLPYIVLVVDELGDLALAKGVDIESLLARLAQMARAAGIHMILATQRPSVDVIVGKTKANFPTRIAFRVATKVDSRTILDTIGADKLLGKGDMLYMDAHNPQPVRLHGAWVSESELEQLINHWKSYDYEEENLDLNAARAGAAELDEELDPLFHDAKGIVIQFKQGSTSLLQRRLHIGYARAARLLDQLEQRGVVGPPDGSKPREVYQESAEPLE